MLEGDFRWHKNQWWNVAGSAAAEQVIVVKRGIPIVRRRLHVNTASLRVVPAHHHGVGYRVELIDGRGEFRRLPPLESASHCTGAQFCDRKVRIGRWIEIKQHGDTRKRTNGSR